MRLKGAVAETGPDDGMRVHRSHWASFRGVVGSRRQNGRRFLEMRDGTGVPVNRRYLKAARDAGLLR